MNRHRLILVGGCPGSGKSTYLSKIPNAKIISRDKIRFSLLDVEDEYFSKEKEVWQLYVKKTKEALKKYPCVYLDATHLNIASRTKILRALGNSLKDVDIECIFFDIPLEVCLERNANRVGREYVPPASIENMYKSREIPILEEGFSAIKIIYENGACRIYE